MKLENSCPEYSANTWYSLHFKNHLKLFIPFSFNSCCCLVWRTFLNQFPHESNQQSRHQLLKRKHISSSILKLNYLNHAHPSSKLLSLKAAHLKFWKFNLLSSSLFSYYLGSLPLFYLTGNWLLHPIKML